METSNIINVIVSALLILAGCGFLLFTLLKGSWEREDFVCFIIASILILYGGLRIYFTNVAARQR